MKKILLIILVITVIAITIKSPKNSGINQTPKILTADSNAQGTVIISDKLQIPWSLVFLPDKSILFTERPGRIRSISPSGILNPTPLAVIQDVKAIGEGGLLGIEIHPKFNINQYVYVYYTYSGVGNNTLNKIARFTYLNNLFTFDKVILDGIPGNINHNGGRLKFGPDGYLYVTTGDSQSPSLAQDKSSLAGKILRLTDDGKPAPGNPFSNLVYSYGHRNPQGLAWDEQGRLWETEHGPSTGDEINLIEIGKNYGWPQITKTQTKEGMEIPVINSEKETWAPSGLVYVKPFLYFAGLRGNSLFRLGTTSMKFDQFLKGKYGRLRDVVIGPDGFLYLSTSNMDGRSLTHLDGDKIIRLNPSDL